MKLDTDPDVINVNENDGESGHQMTKLDQENLWDQTWRDSCENMTLRLKNQCLEGPPPPARTLDKFGGGAPNDHDNEIC